MITKLEKTGDYNSTFLNNHTQGDRFVFYLLFACLQRFLLLLKKTSTRYEHAHNLAHNRLKPFSYSGQRGLRRTSAPVRNQRLSDFWSKLRSLSIVLSSWSDYSVFRWNERGLGQNGPARGLEALSSPDPVGQSSGSGTR